MAALTAVGVNKFYIGDKKVATGSADITSSGGYVTAAVLGMNYIDAVLGVIEYAAANETYAAIPNSTTGSDTSNGDLWIDCSGSTTLYFTVMGK